MAKWSIDELISGAKAYSILRGSLNGHKRWFVTCACGVKASIGFPINTSTEKLVSTFRASGFTVDTKHKPICPACSKKDHGMSRTAIAPDPKLARKVFGALEDHFDEIKKLYKPGWSDAKIATDLGVSPDLVISLRKGAFGELAEDPHLTQFRDDIELLKMEFSDKFATLSNDFTKRLGELEGRITAFKKVA